MAPALGTDLTRGQQLGVASYVIHHQCTWHTCCCSCVAQLGCVQGWKAGSCPWWWRHDVMGAHSSWHGGVVLGELNGAAGPQVCVTCIWLLGPRIMVMLATVCRSMGLMMHGRDVPAAACWPQVSALVTQALEYMHNLLLQQHPACAVTCTTAQCPSKQGSLSACM